MNSNLIDALKAQIVIQTFFKQTNTKFFIFFIHDQLPMVAALESRWVDLYSDRSTELMERRRQDTRDQAEEVTSASSQLSYFFK